ncbi:ThuA domain-containing protein [Singulisphaera sp. PoT]|uniref:ThuA domain-containing protein n=1 Tax=Singulisphaera sp. PoT TaxID=3411797 RepID=UPI003BF465C7
MSRITFLAMLAAFSSAASTAGAAEPGPIKALIITGDNVGAHDWKGTTQIFQDFLAAPGRISIDVTTTPTKDLTPENLAKYDVLLLNYKDTAQGAADTRWSEANKEAFLKAVHGGKGLVVAHFASASFTKPNWEEFERAIAGGWRSQGFHGPAHEFVVKKSAQKHPISEGLVEKFDHPIDELYQNSLLPEGSVVLATAYSDPAKPKGTGKDEAVIWVNHYGKGRVFNSVLGHGSKAMADPNYQAWMRRGLEWAAAGEVTSQTK